MDAFGSSKGVGAAGVTMVDVSSIGAAADSALVIIVTSVMTVITIHSNFHLDLRAKRRPVRPITLSKLLLALEKIQSAFLRGEKIACLTGLVVNRPRYQCPNELSNTLLSYLL